MKFTVNRKSGITVSTAAAAALAASLAMTGTSLAAAGPARSAPAAKTGTEYLQEMSYSATSPVNHVIAHGVFTAAGTDTQHGLTDVLKFPGGTMTITIKVTSAHHHADPGTCASTLVLDVTYKITKGTGKFAGVTGSGHATNTALTLAAQTAHGCSTSKAIAQQSLVTASGPVTLR